MQVTLTIISFVFRLYSFLILIRVLLSWIQPDPYRRGPTHPLIRVLFMLTEPVLAPLRRVIPPIGGAIDISPAVALILLEIVRMIVVSLMARI